MGSHRAKSHQAYDPYFRNLLEELRLQQDAGQLQPIVEGEMPKSRAFELKARFYTWRKLLSEYVAKNRLSVESVDIEDLLFAQNVRTKIAKTFRVKEDGREYCTIGFYIETGEEILQHFGFDSLKLNQLEESRKKRRAGGTFKAEVQSEMDKMLVRKAIPQASNNIEPVNLAEGVAIDPNRPVDAPFKF